MRGIFTDTNLFLLAVTFGITVLHVCLLLDDTEHYNENYLGQVSVVLPADRKANKADRGR